MKARLGLIGLGRQGRRYLESRNGGDAITCSLTRDRLESTRNAVALIGMPQDYLFERFFEEADACIIATPADTHAELAIRCLEAGKPVLVEKPLATTWADCARVIDLAERKGLPLLVGHTHLFSSAWQPHVYTSGDLHADFSGPCKLAAWLDWGPHLGAMAIDALGVPTDGFITRQLSGEFARYELDFASGRRAELNAWRREQRQRDVDIDNTWTYDADAPCEHAALFNQVECFKRMIAGEADRRGTYEFARAVYRTLFGELQCS